MEEHTYWIAFWRLIATVIIACTAIIGGCNAHRTSAIRDMANKGVNPLDAKCALQSTDNACALRIVTRPVKNEQTEVIVPDINISTGIGK